MVSADEIRWALDVASETTLEGPCSESPILAACVWELYEAHKRSLRDMDRIDEVCGAFGVHRFTHMRAELEDINVRYGAALGGGDDE
jgi:hypothetical protein